MTPRRRKREDEVSADREIEQLKHKHEVLRAALDIPTEVVDAHVRELHNVLRERSKAFVGPEPTDAKERAAWALRREAFELMVVKVLGRSIEH